MRVGLSTGLSAKRPKSFSQGRYSLNLMTAPISRIDCKDLELLGNFIWQAEHFDIRGVRQDGTEVKRILPFQKTSHSLRNSGDNAILCVRVFSRHRKT